MKKTLLIGIISLISIFALHAQSRLVVWCHGVPTYYNVSDVDSIVFENSAVPQTQLPTVTTHAASNITVTTATCGGNVTSDGGAIVTTRGVCWSTSSNPTIADSHTTDGSGTGSFTSSLTGLAPNTTYYARAYATNSMGTAYGNEVTFTTSNPLQDGQPCPATPILTDIDGNTYNTVQIGEQCWMKENLRTTRYADNTPISQGSEISTTTAYWYYPNSNSYNKPTYGLLYNWKAVMRNSSSSNTNPSGVQGICPDGWHVPSDAEWKQMEIAVGMMQSLVDNTGYRGEIAAKLSGNTGWTSSSTANAAGNLNAPDRNSTGFSALPAGYYRSGGFYEGFGHDAFFWSATEYSSTSIYWRQLNYNNAGVHRGPAIVEYYGGFSVRCVRDTTVLPIVTTHMASNITATTATCGGNVSFDGYAVVTARGVCWSTSPNPTLADSHTTDGSGTGSFTSSLTGLAPNTTYYVRAYATNSVGTAYGNDVDFTFVQPCPGAPTLTDIDGNTYNTVLIGQQCWMKEDLRTTKYADGISISQGSNTSSTMAYWYYPNDSSSNKPTYGLLYNWKAVMRNSFSSSANPSGVQGICPNGWHVPSDAEWKQMEITAGMSQSDADSTGRRGNIAAKLSGNTGWTSSSTANAAGNLNAPVRNSTGFSALPAGYYSYSSYTYFGYGTGFWSATESSSTIVYCRGLTYNDAGVDRGTANKASGYSVRCLRNGGGSTTTLPTITTPTASNITATAATCGGNVSSDGGAAVIVRGVCWSTSSSPTVADSHTTDGSGTGSFTSSLTGLAPNTIYYIRAYATNSVGTAYGNEVTFITVQPCPGEPILTDIDGNTYNTVLIGQQCWMRENLRTTKYADNTSISQGSNYSYTTAYWFYPGNEASNKPIYGLLYNWKAVMRDSSSSSSNPSGVQGICPDGWHVPSDAEWKQMEITVGMSQSDADSTGWRGNIASKLSGNTGWTSSSTANTAGNLNAPDRNSTGFSALPAGNGSYYTFGNNTDFWSATESNGSSAWLRLLNYNSAGVLRDYSGMNNGFSVRCLRD